MNKKSYLPRTDSRRTGRKVLAMTAAVTVAALLLLIIVPPALAEAEPTTPPTTETSDSTAEPDVSIYSDTYSPLGTTSVAGIVGRVVRGIIGISGVIALAMFVYGGITWMTAQGNSERVDKARRTVVWSVLGLVIIFASYSLVGLVLSALSQ